MDRATVSLATSLLPRAAATAASPYDFLLAAFRECRAIALTMDSSTSTCLISTLVTLMHQASV